MTVPRMGLSLAVPGMRIPPEVLDSASIGSTRTFSCSGWSEDMAFSPLSGGVLELVASADVQAGMPLQITLGAVGMGSMRAGEMSHRVEHPEAGDPGKIDRRQTGRQPVN